MTCNSKEPFVDYMGKDGKKHTYFETVVPRFPYGKNSTSNLEKTEESPLREKYLTERYFVTDQDSGITYFSCHLPSRPWMLDVPEQPKPEEKQGLIAKLIKSFIGS